MAKANSTDTRTQDQKHNDEANRLSMKMCYLGEIVKLAALAAESTRTLSDIHDALAFMPEAKERLSEQVRAMSSWQDRENNTGEVLAYVAHELESLNERFSAIAHRKVNTP